MHIGGMLSRQRSGIRVMHLAEILASTEDADPPVHPVETHPVDSAHDTRATRVAP